MTPCITQLYSLEFLVSLKAGTMVNNISVGSDLGWVGLAYERHVFLKLACAIAPSGFF